MNIKQIVTLVGLCAFAVGAFADVVLPAKDYPLQPDRIHYTREAQQDFGKRYFAAYQGVCKALAADPDYWKKARFPLYLQPKDIPEDQRKDLDPAKLSPAAVRYAFPPKR